MYAHTTFQQKEEEEYFLQDYCDDNEIGAGAKLLEAMQKNQVTHKAFFVVRYTGKQKIKEDRFKGYLSAVTALIAQKPINSITKKQQNIQEQQISRKATSSAGAKIYDIRSYGTQKGNTSVNAGQRQSPRGRGGKNGRGSYVNAASPK